MRPALALAAAALLGCSPVLTQPITEAASSDSPVSPLERLGRWDGARFRGVAPGSIPPSHVHVLIHGWAPGWSRTMVEDRQRRSWETEGFETWTASMATAIAAADPHAVVLAYSWIDDAATNRFPLASRHAWSRTERQGLALAEALQAALGEGFVAGSGRVHLIGHSYGGRVAAFAAILLDVAPRQLTLLDTPDASVTHITGSQSGLAPLLAQLRIGRGPEETFVDNYVSMIGTRYGTTVAGVVDVALSPPFSPFAYRPRHLYPTEFYTRSGGSAFGLGWSPLVADRAPAGGCYEQPYGELALRRGCASIF